MTRSALDRRRKAHWPPADTELALLPRSKLPSTKLPQPILSERQPATNRANKIGKISFDTVTPSPSGIKKPKPEPRGAPQHGQYSDLIDLLNESRVNPQDMAVYEPKSHFDWSLSDEESEGETSKSKSKLKKPGAGVLTSIRKQHQRRAAIAALQAMQMRGVAWWEDITDQFKKGKTELHGDCGILITNEISISSSMPCERGGLVGPVFSTAVGPKSRW